MYPIIKASGTYSPGSAGNSVADATARANSYTVTIPSTAKATDVLWIISSCDSGLPVNCPVPTLADHTFLLEVTSGGDSTSGLHSRAYVTELGSDGAKTIQLTGVSGNTADTAIVWVLFDGSSVVHPAYDLTDTARNTNQITAATAHTLPERASMSTPPSPHAMAINVLANDANTASATYSYTAPSGWTKLAEIGSRQFLDVGVFTRNHDTATGYAATSATYGASAVYTRFTLFVAGAPDFTVEHVSSQSAAIVSGGRVWCDKPVGASPDDDPSIFPFTSQSTTRSRVSIHRFRNVHPTRPLQTAAALFGANTATAATAHVGPDLSWQARSMAVWCWSTNAPNGVWNGYSPATGMANGAILPSNTAMEHLVGYRANPASAAATVTSAAQTATYSVSNVWNSAGIALRAADTLASGVEVLLAFHTMDASQSSGTMGVTDWSGWTPIGTLTRISTSGASNIKVYMQVVEAPKALTWQSLTDVGSTATVGTEAGYTGTQRQEPGTTNVSGPSPLPVEAAPFGRAGLAIRADIATQSQRAEHNPNHRQFTNGDDYFFSFAFALPLGYPTWVNDFNVIEQIHAASDQGSPVVSFEVRDWSLRYRGGDGKPGASPSNAFLYNIPLVQNLRVGRWYEVVYRILFHEDPTITAVDIWVDGVRLVNTHRPPGGTVYKDSIPAANGPGPSYRKQGIYKRASIEGGGPGLQPWHASSALGRSYAAVDPARLHTPTTSPDLFPASA